MSNVYKRVMYGSGIAAAMAATGWLVAAAISLSDGAGGIEVPRWLSTAGVMVIVCGAVLAGGGWLVACSARDAAERYLRPLIRQELDQAFADNMPLFVATVIESVERRAKAAAERFGDRVDGQLNDVATRTARQTAAMIREAHTEDLSEICHDLHRKTLVAGHIMQANATGEAIGKTALRVVSKQDFVTTSTGD